MPLSDFSKTYFLLYFVLQNLGKILLAKVELRQRNKITVHVTTIREDHKRMQLCKQSTGNTRVTK
jgi:hypothetical protein